ncbi:MAG: hypothetical protein FJ119_12125 [Deltaproteobacteria bacterium]|nr:hypothetical protein [Deltaproteobacteria bacterium]
MKVNFKGTWLFLQHTGAPQVFKCGLCEDAPEELLNDPAFQFQLEHGMIEIIEQPKAEPEVLAEIEQPKAVIGPEAKEPNFDPIPAPEPKAKKGKKW